MDVPSQQSLDLRALMNRSRIVKSKTPYRSRIVMFLHNFDSCVIIRTYASVGVTLEHEKSAYF